MAQRLKIDLAITLARIRAKEGKYHSCLNLLLPHARCGSAKAAHHAALIYDLLVQSSISSTTQYEFVRNRNRWACRAAQWDSAFSEYVSGRYLPRHRPKALSQLKKLARDLSDPDASFELGTRFLGYAGPRNLLQSRYWFNQSLKVKNSPYIGEIALMLIEGREPFSYSPFRGLNLLHIAVSAGDASAQNTLGTYYATGYLDLSKDPVAAARLYASAADKGNLLAIGNLAKMYLFGNEGFPKDSEQARYWLEKGVEMGDFELEVYLQELSRPKFE